MRQGRNFEMLRMFRFQGWRSLRGACSQTGRFSHFKGFRASAGCCRKGGTLTRQPTAHRPLQFSGNLPLIFPLMFPHTEDFPPQFPQFPVPCLGLVTYLNSLEFEKVFYHIFPSQFHIPKS